MEHEKFTAVEWLSLVFDDKPKPNWLYDTIKDAEDMEEEQAERYAHFCIECYRHGLLILKFKDYINKI
jgi:hypothetical protein